MSEQSAISWTEATWNPTTGCDRVSPGCANCYALAMAKRLKAAGNPRYQKDGGPASGPGFGLTVHPDLLDLPLRWKKPRLVFVDSMSDLFHEDVPDEFIGMVFAVMAAAERHTFQVLTKRPERMRRLLKDSAWNGEYVSKARCLPGTFELVAEWPLRNIWLGVSVENQHWADERIPVLLETPAAVRFLSCEPLLGGLDLTRIDLGIKRTQGYGDRRIIWDALTGWEHQFKPDARSDALPDCSASGPHRRIGWVIAGGESGPGRAERKLVAKNWCGDDCPYTVHQEWRPKPQALEWLRKLRDQCEAAGVAFHFKQWGGPRPTSGGRLLDGREWSEMPNA